jgi:hypothetical protein
MFMSGVEDCDRSRGADRELVCADAVSIPQMHNNFPQRYSTLHLRMLVEIHDYHLGRLQDFNIGVPLAKHHCIKIS